MLIGQLAMGVLTVPARYASALHSLHAGRTTHPRKKSDHPVSSRLYYLTSYFVVCRGLRMVCLMSLFTLQLSSIGQTRERFHLLRPCTSPWTSLEVHPRY